MSISIQVPRYELISSKKCIPEEEKYQNYLLETLNKKSTNSLNCSCPLQPTPYPITKTFYGETCSNYPNAGYNSMVNYYNYSNAFTGFNRLPKQTTLEFGIPIEDPNINDQERDFKKFKTEETFNLNTLKEFDKNLESLKRENQEIKKFRVNQNKENPSYISQDEIKRRKELIFGSIDDLQRYLQDKKDKKINWFKRFVELSKEKGINLCDLIEAKTPEQLEAIIKDILKIEEESQKEREKLMENYTLNNLKKAGIKRKGYNNGRPLDEKDLRFIKRYARYLLFKKIKDEQIGFTDDDNERLYSQSIFKNNKFKEDEPNISSFIAFAKLVFAILDKDKNGFITKDYLVSNVSLDDKILQDLGFENLDNFKQLLINSGKSQNITERDFVNILLGQSGILDDYNNLFATNSSIQNMNAATTSYSRRKKDKGNDIVELSDEEDSDFDLPGLRTHVYDFLELPDNYQKLEALKKLEEETINNNMKYKNKDKNTNKKTNIILNIGKDRKMYISYHEYLTFLRRFHKKDQLNFTIPEPFEFLKKDYQRKKIQKIKEILEDRVKDEDYYVFYQFHANELKKGIWGNKMQNIIEYEREQRQLRTEKLKEKIIAEMKPFSFYEKDERKYKEKIKQEPIPPTFPPFRANAIKWLSQVLIYEDMLKQEKEEREQRIKERMEKTKLASKLPPRMQMYEEERKERERQKKLKYKNELIQERKLRQFKAKEVPDFIKLQTDFENKLNEMKKAAKPTIPEPFTFHEPKKKVALLCKYLDQENDHNAKNPKKKTDINKIIQKMQRKPKIEPKSTHCLDLLMDLRRKELEEKERQIKEKEIEDNIRAEHQIRLRERVLNSKAIVDNTNQLNENRLRHQEEFKAKLQKQKESYNAELKRRLEKVYNRPLLVEQVGNKGEKFSLNKNNQEDLNEILLDPIAGEDEYEQQGEGEDDENYEDDEGGEEGDKNEEVEGEKEQENGEIDEEKNDDENEGEEN